MCCLMNSKCPDAELIESFKKGERQSFNRLVLKYQQSILNLCVRYLGNYQDGEDAAQETFVKVYRNIHKFKGESLFSTWIYRIAVNHCRNYKMSFWTKLKQKAVNINGKKGTEGCKREIKDPEMTPLEELENKRLGKQVIEELNTLNKQHRELVVLRDLQGLSYNEIIEVCGIPMGTVKSKLARARAALKERLKSYVNA